MDSDELLRSHEGIRFQSPEKQLTDHMTKKGFPFFTAFSANIFTFYLLTEFGRDVISIHFNVPYSDNFFKW